MRKLAVTLLITLILYKAVEPLVYSVLVSCVRLSISRNIEKVLDQYNEDENSTINKDPYEDVGDANTFKSSKNKTYNLALNGNRLNSKLELKYNTSIKKLLQQNSETPKSGNIPIFDLGNPYLCPSFKINELKNKALSQKGLWLYSTTLISYIQSIPVPPPQSISA